MNAVEIEAEIGRLVVRMAEWMATHGGDWHRLTLLMSDFGDGRFLGIAALKDNADLPIYDSRAYYSGVHSSPGVAIYTALAALVAEIELNEKKEKVEK